jgi:hypothetical protein
MLCCGLDYYMKIKPPLGSNSARDPAEFPVARAYVSIIVRLVVTFCDRHCTTLRYIGEQGATPSSCFMPYPLYHLNILNMVSSDGSWTVVSETKVDGSCHPPEVPDDETTSQAEEGKEWPSIKPNGRIRKQSKACTSATQNSGR